MGLTYWSWRNRLNFRVVVVAVVVLVPFLDVADEHVLRKDDF
jgi:hypothetical protein